MLAQSAFGHLRQNLVRAQPVGVLVHVAGEDQLIGIGLFQQHIQLGADLLGPPTIARPRKSITASRSWGSHRPFMLSTGVSASGSAHASD
jgi:hypothetical protein